MVDRFCVDCCVDISGRGNGAIRCVDCARKHHNIVTKLWVKNNPTHTGLTHQAYRDNNRRKFKEINDRARLRQRRFGLSVDELVGLLAESGGSLSFDELHVIVGENGRLVGPSVRLAKKTGLIDVGVDDVIRLCDTPLLGAFAGFYEELSANVAGGGK